MKYIRFNDSKVDTNIFLQLQDLSTVLSNIENLEFEYNYGSYIDLINSKVTASHFWDKRVKDEMVNGFKSDVLLRTLGTLKHTSLPSFKEYVELLKETTIPKFGIQLFTFLEDFRLEEMIRKDKPGSARIFNSRNLSYFNYFHSQVSTNAIRGFHLDELFCMITSTLLSNSPDPIYINEKLEQVDNLERIKEFLHSIYDAKSTKDVTIICEKILYRIHNIYQDMINQYFISPVSNLEHYSKNTLFDELTRNDELINCDIEEISEENNEVIDETFSTWHRENENSGRNQTFLQFELESGTKTKLVGNGARESDDSDQALASIQGSSGKSEKKEYNKNETLNKSDNTNGSAKDSPYGEENKFAVPIIKQAIAATSLENNQYLIILNEIEILKKKLYTTIEKHLENKKNSPKRDLLYGRLSKNLLPLAYESFPRVFYKKNNPSSQVDAVFTLMVDCSASMENKMSETINGVALFHETLKRLKVPHSIVGFWEDAYESTNTHQPNYFHEIIKFEDSVHQNNGAKILQLTPQEDNRDGYSIRVLSERLIKRPEKNKFLLVFSDGEPSAMNYDQNGIIDTCEAVLEARKKGIEVIGLFLSDSEIYENEELTMKNIYGKQYLMIPRVSELPGLFSPLLKKLLLKSI